MGTGLPLGVFARGERDFLYSKAGCGHVDNTSTLGNQTVSLFNNANDGTILAVFGFAMVQGTASPGTVSLRFVNGTIGTFFGNTSPLRIGDPQPWGQFFKGTDTGGSDANPLNFLPFILQNQGGRWFSQSPLCFILPGWSLVAAIGNAVAICVNFWFTQERAAH